MGNRRLGRKRLESALKKLNATTLSDTGDRDGKRGFDMPAFELQPAKYFGLFDDFLKVSASKGGAVNENMAQATSIDSDTWSTNVTDAETWALDSTKVGGVLKLTHDDTDAQASNMQALTAGFRVDNDDNPRKIWFEARVNVNDISGTSLFLGLASNAGGEETSMIASLEDGIGFIVADGSSATDIKSIGAVGNQETQTDTGVDMADDTWTVLSFYYDGKQAHFYVNGVLKVSSASNLPKDDTILFPSFEILAQGTDQDVTYLDYIRCCMER